MVKIPLGTLCGLAAAFASLAAFAQDAARDYPSLAQDQANTVKVIQAAQLQPD